MKGCTGTVSCEWNHTSSSYHHINQYIIAGKFKVSPGSPSRFPGGSMLRSSDDPPFWDRWVWCFYYLGTVVSHDSKKRTGSGDPSHEVMNQPPSSKGTTSIISATNTKLSGSSTSDTSWIS